MLTHRLQAYFRTAKPCQLSDAEKTVTRKGKGSTKKIETAWWELFRKKGEPPMILDRPLAHPPDLKYSSELEIGDLFVHRCIQGMQIWEWCESPNSSGVWVSITLGHTRELDSRRLSLTPSQMPSYVLPGWYNRLKANLSGTWYFSRRTMVGDSHYVVTVFVLPG